MGRLARGMAPFLLIVLGFSCKENVINRKDAKLAERNYNEYSTQVCAGEIKFGQVYVEFYHLTKDSVLGLLDAFNDSVIGSTTKEGFSNPWTDSRQWMSHGLFVDYHNDHYGHEVFPYEYDSKSRIIKYGIGNTHIIGGIENYQYEYSLEICPSVRLVSPYKAYSIEVRKALLTAEGVDSLYHTWSTNREHPALYSKWISYKVDEYVANIFIKLKFNKIGKKPEYYRLEMKDTIRAYHHSAF